MSIKFQLAAVDGGPFNCQPACEVEVEAENVHANDVILPHENHPHNCRLFVFGNEFGTLGAVWGYTEKDALDYACDEGMFNQDLMEPGDDEGDGVYTLGNASERFNLGIYFWIRDGVSYDSQVACMFAEARGAMANTLDEV
jgi:hypothetical protein